jgi:hypothetical protein
MAINLEAFQETTEERFIRIRQKTRRRIQILFLVCIALGVARIFIKNPPPPPKADYSKDQIRIVPGMLDQIPASERSKLDSKLIAKMVIADENAKNKSKEKATEYMYAKGSYQAAQPPLEIDQEAENFKQFVYSSAVRKKIDRIAHQEKDIDLTKTTLVQFKAGRFLKVEKAKKAGEDVIIRMDRTILAKLPKSLVMATLENASNWEEPIPRGFVRLKPAKGITVTLSQESAKRISVKKQSFDEI